MFPARFIDLALALLVCAATPLRAATNPPPAVITLTPNLMEGLIEEARTNHPGLVAARHRERAAQRSVDGVRLWADPMVRVGGLVANKPGPDLEMEGDLKYEVEQSLPLFGKATAMRHEAQAGAAVASASTLYASQILRRAIVQALHQLALSDETARIIANDLVLLQRMTGLVRERQRAGLDSALEILRIENEREKRLQELETAKLQRDYDRVSLNRLLGRPIAQPCPTVAQLPIAPPIPLSEAIFDMGVKFEPKLQVMRREIDMADAGIEVTRKGRLPEVSLGIETRQWSGTGDLREGMVSVGLSVPWFNRSRYRADLDRDQAKAAAARADTEDYERDVRRELFRVWTRIDAARREAILYRDNILPRSELAIQTALAGWSAGRTMHLEVHEAHRMLTEAQLMYAKALSEQQQMIAELITCCGIADLDALLMLQPDSAR